MKFGHAFKEALETDSYPQHWVEKAIPYRQLKKILGLVREELIRKGYDPDTLHKLLSDHNARYSLETGDPNLLRPRLVVRPEPTVVSAPDESPAETKVVEEIGEGVPDKGEPSGSLSASNRDNSNGPLPGWISIPLDSDARFFNVLQTDVGELDNLQSQERLSMNGSIKKLGAEISEVAKPRKGLIRISKSDLYRWREIFELYLSAGVFFSTSESASGARSSEKARKQLVWFQDEVCKRQLVQKFKLEASITAYSRFLELNATLLQNVQFQELNQTAVVKIIKSRTRHRTTNHADVELSHTDFSSRI